MLSFLTKSFMLLVWVVSFAEYVPAQDPDINRDGIVNCHDAEAVQFAVRDGVPNPPFGGSLDSWLGAAADSLGYRVINGDTDVDGDVDRWDFHTLAGNHFTRVGVEVFNGWCRGQFDYDGIINAMTGTK